MAIYHLMQMTYPQVEALAKRKTVALIPMAPVEAHGPHLPLATDIVEAEEVVRRAAAALDKNGVEVVILPMLPHALAETSSPFAGTISLRYETVVALVEDICTSLARHNFKRMLVVCFHGEGQNYRAVHEGARNAMERTSAVVRVSDWLRGGWPAFKPYVDEEHPELDMHAGEVETSMVMFTHPDWIDHQARLRLPASWGAPGFFRTLRTEPDKTWLDVDVPRAYLGDPKLATAEKGDKILEVYAGVVIREAEELWE